jgi:hypothetical protein
MKLNIEIDCTPDEARAFLGLPDVQPMQQALMQELEQRLRANMQALDPDVMFRTWLPASIQNAEQLQKMFWSQVQQTLAGAAAATSGMANLALRKTGSED